MLYLAQAAKAKGCYSHWVTLMIVSELCHSASAAQSCCACIALAPVSTILALFAISSSLGMSCICQVRTCISAPSLPFCHISRTIHLMSLVLVPRHIKNDHNIRGSCHSKELWKDGMKTRCAGHSMKKSRRPVKI